MNVIFRRTLFLSLVSHITLFSIFSFSFGNRLPAVDFASVSFWGQILTRADLASFRPRQARGTKLTRPEVNARALGKVQKETAVEKEGFYIKPACSLREASQKLLLAPEINFPKPAPPAKTSVVMFHPLLPYNFLLYFAGRQAVHIELMYKNAPTVSANTLMLKRRISSGNLEADLFVMRYFSHYLFVEQPNLAKSTWQTVKVDLSYEK